MRRRDFLRAAAAGTIGAFLGGLPKALDAGEWLITLRIGDASIGVKAGVWFKRIYGVDHGTADPSWVRMEHDPETDTWIREWVPGEI